MPYVCPNPETYEERVVDGGSSVQFVQKAAGAPHTSQWKQGQLVKEAAYISHGTAIATFFGGVYPSLEHGNHAAIYVSHDAHGILVWDQWKGRPVGKRIIAYKQGDNDPGNDGDFFYVIE